LVVASDLQGVAPLPSDGGAMHLVGEVLAEELAALARAGVLPASARTGVLLCGDLYSSPDADERGATGDVRTVYRAFAREHRWVAGVAGNHDTFGQTPDEVERFRGEERTFVLDDELVELDGLRLGGVGYIIGNPRKPGRRDERAFVRAIRDVLDEDPEILLLHHGPDAQRGVLRGHPEVRRALDGPQADGLLVLCGHVYWPEPMTVLRSGAQVLNADSRVVILERAKEIP
jgi:3',5'-cyclic-AMP phosphodiesterase